MIDFEQWKIKVSLSTSTNNVLLYDMFKYGFVKNNDTEKVNKNLFINKMLPRLFEYRQYRDKKFNKLLDKIKLFNNIDEDTKILLDFYINDFFYNNDMSIHDEKIDIRVSKNNISFFEEHFQNIESCNINKSSFIRSLLNQYANMTVDKREFIFFNKEYHLIEKAIEKHIMVQCDDAKTFPVAIVTCPFDNEIYIVSLIMKDKEYIITSDNIWIYNDCRIINTNIEINIDDINDKIQEYIDDYKYIELDESYGGDH